MSVNLDDFPREAVHKTVLSQALRTLMMFVFAPSVTLPGVVWTVPLSTDTASALQTQPVIFALKTGAVMLNPVPLLVPAVEHSTVQITTFPSWQ